MLTKTWMIWTTTVASQPSLAATAFAKAAEHASAASTSPAA